MFHNPIFLSKFSGINFGGLAKIQKSDLFTRVFSILQKHLAYVLANFCFVV
jgi:hypothetical protein